jgi:hypothetical protein
MSEKISCERILEEVSRTQNLSPESIAHTKSCPECGKNLEIMKILKSTGSFFSTPPTSAEKRLIAKLEQQGFIEDEAPTAPIFNRFFLKLATCCFAMLLIIGLAKPRFFPSSSPDTPAHQTILKSGSILSFEPTQQAHVLPDGSRFLVSAASRVKTAERGLFLFEGTIRLQVEPGLATFAVVTPLATIEVLGTSFEVSVQKQEIHVQLESGKLRIVSPEQPELILLPGQSWGNVACVSTTTGHLPEKNKPFPKVK